MKQVATNLTTENLWSLHLELSEVLRKRMQHELARLDDRLRMLSASTFTRRRYPPARLKFQNPDLPAKPGRVAASNPDGSRQC